MHSAHTSPWIPTRRLHCCTAAAASAAVSHVVTHKTRSQVDSSSALATSLRRQTRGSQPWLGRLGPTRAVQQRTQRVSSRGARPQQQPLVSAFARISARTIDQIFPHLGRLFLFAKFISEKSDRVKIWSLKIETA